MCLFAAPAKPVSAVLLSWGCCFQAKTHNDISFSSSLAIAATECLVAAFPSLNDDVRAVARKVRGAGHIARRVAD